MEGEYVGTNGALTHKSII